MIAERERVPERVIVEALDSHGRVQWRERVALSDERRTFTIGRSVHADVTLDDPYAAALHASVEIAQDGRVLANDLGSVNGLIVRGRRWSNACGVELPDNTLQIGRTLLRVRSGQEPLAPERPYRPLALSPVVGPASIAALAAAVSVLELVYTSWLGAPRDLTMSVVSALSLAASIAGVWIALWGLLSRIILGEWRWLHHSAIYLGISAAFGVVIGAIDLGGFLFALPLPGNRHIWLGAAALGLALYLHIRYASHLAASRAALVACGIPIVLATGGHWLQMRAQVRDVNFIGAYMRIYPPSLRLRPSDKVEDYFSKATLLRELADQRLTDAVADDPVLDGDD
jgi:hypothetical protein